MSEPKWVVSRAKAVWEEGSRSQAVARQFSMLIDEPVSVGGTNRGPRPTEYLLAAFCGCTVVIAERAAKELGVHLNALEVEARGSLDQRGVSGEADVNPCFQTVEGRVRIGPEPAAALAQIRALVEKRCPLHNTLVRSGAAVRMEWVLKEV